MSSLYLHIPFCSRKCPYCDFFSLVGTEQQIDGYVDLLLKHLQLLAEDDSQQLTPLKTVFFGGGTPSLLSAHQLDAILRQIEATFSLENSPEISLEANPGTLDGQKLADYRQVGINRLSLGVQSLNDKKLQTLGRIHSVDQVYTSIAAARSAGFDNINLDLMFGLPGQGLADLEGEATRLLEFSPEHISLYGLSYEEGTDFYRQLQKGLLSSCDEDHYADQYRLLDELLANAGFEHYEISNFSQPGRNCLHNLNYWQRQTCWAIGTGAHSFIDLDCGERWHVPADLARYTEYLIRGQNPAEFLEGYDLNAAMREYIYLALRTRNGVDFRFFEDTFYYSFTEKFSTELRHIENYLEIDSASTSCHLTLSGWLIYDHLISQFL